MTTETSNARELVAKLAAHVRPTCSELWAEAQAFLAAEGAQSGEVSAYNLAVLDDAAETLDRIGEGSAGLREARARIASALSQHPAPPSAPVGVEWIMELADEYDAKGHHDRAYDLRRLAKQPTAVDEAIAQRAAKALLDCRSYIGSERPDDPDDEDSAQWWDELTELAAALATQHREPTDDR